MTVNVPAGEPGRSPSGRPVQRQSYRQAPKSSEQPEYHPRVSVRRMLPHELEATVRVWRAANIARGAPHGAERTARIRAKLSASDALAFVALRPEIVGMALAEPGRLDDAGGLDPTLLHISMVFVHPAAQGTGVGSSLVLHVLDTARSLGYQRADVWTYRDNTPACRLYESVGMAITGKTARVLTRTQIQYGCPLGSLSQVPQAAEGPE
jgi:ribosomal protein S18 acetylase RimI-like enzyme